MSASKPFLMRPVRKPKIEDIMGRLDTLERQVKDVLTACELIIEAFEQKNAPKRKSA